MIAAVARFQRGFAPNLVAEAEDAIARLDERLGSSPIAEGWRARSDFLESCAALWAEGELIQVEDLVLHDAAMDVRTPTPELTRAQMVLRGRRRVGVAKPGWSLDDPALSILMGRAQADPGTPGQVQMSPVKDAIDLEEEAFLAQLAAIDRLIDRSSAYLSARSSELRDERDAEPFPTRDADRLATWRETAAESVALPPVLAAAVVAEAWARLAPLAGAHWLGGLLASDLLRMRKKTRAHLLCLFVGLKGVPRDQRRSRDLDVRVCSWLAAITRAGEIGLRDHDRWLAARRELDHRLRGRRSTSRLPQLVELVISRPICSTALIASELEISMRAAQLLVKELGLREVTGRGRYRAWSVI